MRNVDSPVAALQRLAVAVRGVVQGVGFRPFVYNAATRLQLTGWVRNEAAEVRIEAQGVPTALGEFLHQLQHHPPPQARVDAVESREIPPVDGEAAFEILASGGESAPRPTIPADMAICPECLAEIASPVERRYGYPFTNCTNCGPRWSIIESLPYDRPRTSMAAFEMCPACRAEYQNPADRRFHAQPIACPVCGPQVELLDAAGKRLAGKADALAAAARALLDGKILALEGLGGFQLLVDATDAEAVARLRRRKRRPDRPFAVMLGTLDAVRLHCRVSDEEAAVLQSHQAPIVLLRRISGQWPDVSGQWPVVSGQCETASGGIPNPQIPNPKSENLQISKSPNLQIAPAVAPGNPYLGVMLPYTPLHHLLLAAVGKPVVCTSGNLSDEPMAIDIADALKRLGEIADVFLTHDRPIVRPVDDSIVRVTANGRRILRRARGYAPLPIDVSVLAAAAPTVLAVGGHLKNTVALALGEAQTPSPPAPLPKGEGTVLLPLSKGAGTFSLPLPKGEGSELPTLRAPRPTPLSVPVILGAHVGDLDSPLSVAVFRRAIDDLLGFFHAKPDVVACDLHPDYASTRHAEQLAARWGVPLVRVQHHHAHVAAVMAEHGLAGPVLGFAWDGTGYGPDGTVWGGEALVCQGADYRRAAHFRTFRLPGGESAIREPRRASLGLLFELLGDEARWHASTWFNAAELDGLMSMLARGVNSPLTSSLGRLFDAVAVLVGLPPTVSFEGQAAMSLEFAADEGVSESYPLNLSSEGDVAIIDWGPMLRELLADRAAGLGVARLAARFHDWLAEAAAAVALKVAEQKQLTPAELPVAISGGCFQNALLDRLMHERLSAAGFSVYTQHSTPPGDGGIALGQVFVALHSSLSLCERCRG